MIPDHQWGLYSRQWNPFKGESPGSSGRINRCNWYQLLHQGWRMQRGTKGGRKSGRKSEWSHLTFIAGSATQFKGGFPPRNLNATTRPNQRRIEECSSVQRKNTLTGEKWNTAVCRWCHVIRGEGVAPPHLLKGKSSNLFYSTIGSELCKLRHVSIGNFHRNNQKLVKFSF